MDVFTLHEHLIKDYAAFTSRYIAILDSRIREHVERGITAGEQWPDPYLALNPNFAPGGSVSDLVRLGILHPECERIFRIGKTDDDDGTILTLYRHQRQAIEIARTGV